MEPDVRRVMMLERKKKPWPTRCAHYGTGSFAVPVRRREERRRRRRARRDWRRRAETSPTSGDSEANK